MTAEPLSDELSMQVDAGFGRRRVGAQVRSQLLFRLSPVMIGLVAILVGQNRWPLEALLLSAAGLLMIVRGIAGIVAMVVREQRTCRIRYPVGSTIAVAYSADHLVVRSLLEEVLIPYSGLLGAVESGDFVLLHRRGEAPVRLPAELCPPDVRARFLAAVAAAPVVPPTIPASFVRQVVTDERYARAAVRLAAAHGARRAGWLLPMLAWSVIAVAGVLLGAWLAAALALVGIASLAVPLIGCLQGWPTMAGIAMRTRFDDDGFVFAEGDGAVKWAYEFFDEVRVQGDIVELRVADDRVWGQYPRELFPDVSLARFAGTRVS